MGRVLERESREELPKKRKWKNHLCTTTLRHRWQSKLFHAQRPFPARCTIARAMCACILVYLASMCACAGE